MTVVDELVAVLGYELEGQGNLTKFNSGLDQAEKSARASSDRMKKFGVAATVAGAAVGAAGAKGYKEFAGFERQMTRIGIAAGATAEDTAKAGETVQTMALGFGLPIQDAVQGLDTLVASGLDLDEAMSFLPSVLATAQAAGASTTDIANTALKTSSALKLTAADMQTAFDIMVSGGKAGQFELKDMAQHIPELANSFASLGYTGQDGLQRLIAYLQTVREDTGSAGSAATQLGNVFQKIFAEETSNKFAKFGIDLRAELDAARANGEDVLQAFVDISKATIDGDLTKLPLLFTDKELQLGMQSLITSQESFDRFLESVNGAEVDGAVLDDLNRVLADSQANLDRLSTTWDTFFAKLGGRVAVGVNPVLDAGIQYLEDDALIDKQLESEGMGWWRRNVFVAPWERQAALERAQASQEFSQTAAQSEEAAPLEKGDRKQMPDRAGKASAGLKSSGYASGENATSIGKAVQSPISLSAPSITVDTSETPDALTVALPEPEVRLPGISEGLELEPEAFSARFDAAVSPSSSEPANAELNQRISEISARLAQMTPENAATATITDARQDHRDQSMTNNIEIHQQVTEAAQAPGALARASGDAVANSVGKQRSQIETSPSF
ncbi:phage tail tape measure protein [Roseibium alexandrii]|uniref:Phage tail tape measure protein, TP901 family, core region n=1 Tax=Roseibium alexandrii TaxID=388408 RepID=A0A0M6ZZY8_9HYPH|nr:phage tail tape measure protein [Roseibium alexandrii]CTQ67114.1 phage tail tape measure protein, TP901 family, core region [Roseibium alexandrii]